MAKKKGVNKTKAVLAYWNQHPDETAAQVAKALTKQGLDIKIGYIYNIRNKSKKKPVGKKAAPQVAAMAASQPAAAATPKAPEKRTEPAGTITLQHIKAVAQTVKAMGGFDRLNELVSLIKEVGGLRRFKDLVDAIMANESS